MPATVWTDVTIFNDEYLSEAKLDAMQGNADYVRDDHKVLLVAGAPSILGGGEFNIGGLHNHNSGFRIKLTMGAQVETYSGPIRLFQTSQDSWVDFAMVNVPWTDPAVGSSADLVVSAEYAQVWDIPPWIAVGELFRVPSVFRRSDWNYFSLWLQINPLANKGAFFADVGFLTWVRTRFLTLVAHREQENFS